MREAEPEMAACLVEHDVRLVAAVCSRMQALNFGKVIAVGSSKEVLADPEVREAYLGRGDTRDAEVFTS
jgi:branched-chain amino acid transport system ATP-binding protein